MRLGLLLSIPLWAGIFWLFGLTGCGAIGVKNIDLWGAKMEFSEGVDYSFGFNGVDAVDNRRGLSRKVQNEVSADRRF